MAAGNKGSEGVLLSLSESPIDYNDKQVASDTGTVVKKLLKSTGKAAWIAGTTLSVIVVTLIVEMDRDLQQASLLGTPSTFATQK